MENLVAKFYFDSSWRPKWSQLEALSGDVLLKKRQYFTVLQAQVFQSRLLATSFYKMVAARKILVAKKESVFKAGHLMSLYMK